MNLPIAFMMRKQQIGRVIRLFLSILESQPGMPMVPWAWVHSSL
jgi:hypothetical protein